MSNICGPGWCATLTGMAQGRLLLIPAPVEIYVDIFNASVYDRGHAFYIENRLPRLNI
jgi:hypothetical protein